MNEKPANQNKVKKAVLLTITAFIILGVFLSVFRAPKRDETYYLNETILLAKLIENGEWFGDYGVGLHGFITKIPAALIFLTTGPSVFVATFTNVLMAAISLYLLYLIMYKHLKMGWWSLAGVFLLASNYMFLYTTASFLRDIPSLLATLLLTESILSKRSPWIIGMCLLLTLDAKEHVFVMLVIPLIGYTALQSHLSENCFMQRIKHLAFMLTKILTPSFMFTVLMFTTHLVPVNMFWASLTGFTTTGFTYQINHVNPKLSTLTAELENLSKEASSPAIKTLLNIQNSELRSYLWMYLYKAVSPGLFSLLTVSIVLIVPALFVSSRNLVTSVKDLDSEQLYLSLVPLIFFLIILLRRSNGRYFETALPFIIIFFLLFLKGSIRENRRFFVAAFCTTALFTTLSLLAEQQNVPVKVFIEGTYLLLILAAFLSRKKRKLHSVTTSLTILFIGATSLATYFASTALYTYGQLNRSIKWGINMESQQIAQMFSKDEKVLINNPGWDHLVKTYREDVYITPEYHWELSPSTPKERMLKTLGEPTTHMWKSAEETKELSKELNVDKVVLVESTIEGSKFDGQDGLKTLLYSTNWLKYDKVVKLKNKNVYVFSVMH